mmetsp:Transcript_140103/g.390571  ORF Transcript_140103/g.390571 Transcript_140103/m.390571 type:complete len:126 (-) Transcript_140103:244-621(-)
MDPVMNANLRCFVTSKTQHRSTSSPASSTARMKCTFEREKLTEARRMRGKMVFMDRMEVDSDSKRAYRQVCDLRKDPRSCAALDKMVEKMRPSPKAPGPNIVSHDHRWLYEGHGKTQNWAPLEYY